MIPTHECFSHFYGRFKELQEQYDETKNGTCKSSTSEGPKASLLLIRALANAASGVAAAALQRTHSLKVEGAEVEGCEVERGERLGRSKPSSGLGPEQKQYLQAALGERFLVRIIEFVVELNFLTFSQMAMGTTAMRNYCCQAKRKKRK